MTVPPDSLEVVIFDLDGVLVDSVPPIRKSMNAALAAVGRPPLDQADVRPLIGPPLETSAAMVLGTDDPEDVAAFVRRFRETYQACYLTATRPAPGLTDVLPRMADRYRLLVATSKPAPYAVPLLAELGVDRWFRAILGRSLDLDHATKADVIGQALAHVPGVPVDRILMVGDRRYDVAGAGEHGIRTVGVTSGAGGADELRQAGAVHLVEDLPALAAWLNVPV